MKLCAVVVATLVTIAFGFAFIPQSFSAPDDVPTKRSAAAAPARSSSPVATPATPAAPPAAAAPGAAAPKPAGPVPPEAMNTISFDGLTEDQKRLALSIMNDNGCDCGCGMK